MSLADLIATPDRKRTHVRRLFATIADRYDLITVLLSYGQDRRWKARVVAMAQARQGMRALDLATGTGDIAFGLAARGARVIGIDVTHRMIELANVRAAALRNAPFFMVGDMVALPIAGNSVDLATAGYGLRNVPDLAAAIAEIHRVLVPGG